MEYYMHTGTGILIFGEACILSPLTDWDAMGMARIGCARSMFVARNRVDCIVVLCSQRLLSGEWYQGGSSMAVAVGALRSSLANQVCTGLYSMGGRGTAAQELPAWVGDFPSSTSSPDRIPCRAALESSDSLYPSHLTDTRANTANMSDDEERVTMPFKFVTGTSSAAAARPL